VQEHSLLSIMEIAGPVILLLLLVWVILRNRKSRVSKDVGEDATRANYQADDRASKNDDI
jgi:hypothetical protein